MVRLHIEPTSRCTLGCPRCERTTFIDKFGKNNFSVVDLNIEDFINFIDIKIDKIYICGNLGDPIYHRDFLKLVKMTKTKTDRVSITTNGSRKSKIWWSELVSILDERDNVTFSIDGTPDNFTKYRINGDWQSIKTGIDICTSSKVKTTWKYIPFSFNEDNVEDVKIFSSNLGIDRFKLDPSDRWLIDDPLRPTEFIGPRDTVQQLYKKEGVRDFDIDPKCKDNKHHYINAAGYYLPCCYSNHYEFYYKNSWWKNRDKHRINATKLSEQIAYFKKFYSTIKTERYDYCVFNCGKC